MSYILNFDGLSGSGREITDLDQAKPLTGKDLVVSIDDPMHHIYFCKYVIETMLENDFFQDEEDYKQVANGCYLFSNGFLATKLLRCVFGNNSLMVYTNGEQETNAIGYISEDEIEETMMIAEKFNLCLVIYDGKPRRGFTHVNMNFEPDTKQKSKPNHLKIWEVKFNLIKRPTIPKFKDWYYSMTRYHLYQDQWKLENLTDEKWRIRFRRWSWLPLLVPLAANEDTTNVPNLLKKVWLDTNSSYFCHQSLKMIMNALQTHPCQITGFTTQMIYSHKLKGNEVPFGNFHYIIQESGLQWSQPQNVDPNVEWTKSVMYKNDWKLKSPLQTMIMETFTEAKWQLLQQFNFPMNLVKIWEMMKNEPEKYQEKNLRSDENVEKKSKYAKMVLNILRKS